MTSVPGFLGNDVTLSPMASFISSSFHYPLECQTPCNAIAYKFLPVYAGTVAKIDKNLAASGKRRYNWEALLKRANEHFQLEDQGSVVWAVELC